MSVLIGRRKKKIFFFLLNGKKKKKKKKSLLSLPENLSVEESMESLCKLISTVGESLDHSTSTDTE